MLFLFRVYLKTATTKIEELTNMALKTDKSDCQYSSFWNVWKGKQIYEVLF